MARKKKTEFALWAPAAQSVALAGTFNGWDPGQTPMQKDGEGVWKAKLSLPPGRHEYRFVADGQWICDPEATESAPNPHGGDNSVIVV
jgi:1,4-alpha-glucan branching enzyme